MKVSQNFQISLASIIRTYLGYANINKTKRMKQDFNEVKKRIGQKLTG